MSASSPAGAGFFGPQKPTTGHRFLVLPDESGPRLFGLTPTPGSGRLVLFAVATLTGATTLQALNVAAAMDQFVLDGTRQRLDQLLARFPAAVRAACLDVLPSSARSDLGVPDFAHVWFVHSQRHHPERYVEGVYRHPTPRSAALLWVEGVTLLEDLDHAIYWEDRVYLAEQMKAFSELPRCTYAKTPQWRRRTRDLARRLHDRFARGEGFGGTCLGEKVLWHVLLQRVRAFRHDQSLANLHPWILELPAHPQDWDYGLLGADDEDVAGLYAAPAEHEVSDGDWFGTYQVLP